MEFVVSLDRPSALPVPFEYYTQSGGGSLTAQAGTDYTQVQPTAAAIAATATDATATLSGLRVTHSVQPGAQRLAVQTLQEDPPAAEGVERFSCASRTGRTPGKATTSAPARSATPA